jgi:hypothetical protein
VRGAQQILGSTEPCAVSNSAYILTEHHLWPGVTAALSVALDGCCKHTAC